MRIKDILLRKILDSRGNYTVECELVLFDNSVGICSIPSGKSIGFKEINCLDFNKYDLLSINEFVKHKLISINDVTQYKLEKELKNINKYFFLGGNVMLSISIAFMKAVSKSNNLELYKYIGNYTHIPMLMINVLNGGVHSDNNLSFQEFMIIPNFDNYLINLNNSLLVFHSLKKILHQNNLGVSVGDEGGFSPKLSNVEDALKYLKCAVNDAGFVLGKNFYIGIDCAASEFYDKKNDKYLVNNKIYNSFELTQYYLFLINKYNIISIEDPFYESDFKSFHNLKSLTNILIVGDDLICSNYKYLKKSIKNDSCNCIIIKPNQIGSVGDMIKCINLAKKNNIKTIMSHRSGETEDTFIADFAVGYNTSFVKFGSLSRTERTCKYNRLLKIYENK